MAPGWICSLSSSQCGSSPRGTAGLIPSRPSQSQQGMAATGRDPTGGHPGDMGRKVWGWAGPSHRLLAPQSICSLAMLCNQHGSWRSSGVSPEPQLRGADPQFRSGLCCSWGVACVDLPGECWSASGNGGVLLQHTRERWGCMGLPVPTPPHWVV